MTAAAPLRVACLGAGYFAGFHFDAWRRIDRADLVGVADHDLARAEATGAPAYGGLDTMLAGAAPDLLDIIVPPAGHRAAIETALAAGIRSLVCQKPFCTSPAEARAAVEAAEAAGATLIVHENFRFQPWYRAIRAALDAGRIGTLHQATFRLRPGDGQGPRAYLDRQPYFQEMPRFLVHETGVHWIDTFRFLMGEATGVYADLRRLNPAIAGEDAGYLVFDHANGARALLDGNRHLDHAAANPRLTMGEALFEGTAGTLTLTGDGAVTLRPFGASRAETLLAPRDRPGFGGDAVRALQAHVVAAVLDGAPAENAARDYLRVLEIEEMVYRSAAEGRKLEL